jgi:hypothetical protein
MPNIKVLQVNKVCYDVFTKTGWESWARILWSKKKNQIKQVAGTPLSKEELTNLQPLLESYNEETKHEPA